MSDTRVKIAAVRRLTVHDGPGVRDTVFVKGCPLNCVWCHNPESISGKPQLLYHENVCSGCGDCSAVCPQGVHEFKAGWHVLDRKKCISCGACAENCCFNALEICGKSMTADDVFSQVIRDKDFFDPVGGVTLSGGEPALFPDFSAALFQKLRQAGIHTALDTCGAVAFENYRKILPFTNLVLFDLKGMDPRRHKVHTGKDNKLIHKNLQQISAWGTPIEIRMPIVPGLNDFPEDIEQTGLLLTKIKTLTMIRLLPYHPLAAGKYAAAGMPDPLMQAAGKPVTVPPSQRELENIAGILQSYHLKTILSR